MVRQRCLSLPSLRFLIFGAVCVFTCCLINVGRAQSNATTDPSEVGIKQKPVTRWRAPIGNRTKINSHACWLPSGEAHGGIIARDSRGAPELLQVISFQAQTSLVAEAMVMREAVTLAANLGILRVVFENDNLELIQACRGMAEIGEIRGLVHDIKAQLCCFSEVGFTWVGRAGNQAAHEIANLQRNQSLGSNWSFHLPTAMKEVIRIEAEGVRM